jgi:hypothetical protein
MAAGVRDAMLKQQDQVARDLKVSAGTVAAMEQDIGGAA